MCLLDVTFFVVLSFLFAWVELKREVDPISSCFCVLAVGGFLGVSDMQMGDEVDSGDIFDGVRDYEDLGPRFLRV